MELGDFDGDGRVEAVVVFNDINIPNNSRTFLFGLSGWHELTVASTLDRIAMSTIDLMRAGDLNGDGRHELMVFRDHGTKNYHAFNISDDHQLTQTATGWFNHTYAPDDFQLWPADFNGDGITDYLARIPNGWKVLVGRSNLIPGEGAFTESALDLDVPFASSHRIFVADLDGNGMSDILHYYPSNGWKMRARYTYGMTGNTPLFHAPPAFATQNTNSELIVGDHNGDGKQDIIGSNDQSSTITYTRFNAGAQERVLSLCSDGYCNRVEFTYATHRRGAYQSLEYPLIEPGSIGLVVQNLVLMANGVVGYSQSYSFTKARSHVAGLGFIGFMETSATSYSGELIRTSRSISAPHFTPLDTDIRATLIGPGTELSHTRHTYEQTPIGQTGSMGVYTKLITSHTDDLLSGAVTDLENEWDEHGNITQTWERINDDLLTVRSVYQYGIFGPLGIPDRVVHSQITSTRTGQDPVTVRVRHDYDTRGGLIQSTEHPGEDLEIVTRFERNARGVVIRRTTSAPSLSNGARPIDYELDQNSRFTLVKTIWWNKNGTMVPVIDRYAYDERWGAVLRQVGPDGLTTLTAYDAFGRPTETQIPHVAGSLRHAITHQRRWALDPSNGQTYMLATLEPGTARSEQYYNATGQLVRERTEMDHSGDWTTTTRVYNDKGLLVQATEPHRSTEDHFTIHYEYDDLDRPVREANSFFGETTYVYDHPGAGDVVRTATTPDGQVRTTRTDATGVVREADDAGGTLDYHYDSRGSQIRVTLNNEIVAMMEYDQYGRQTSLYDPNTGITRYTYDAFGQLTYLRDAEGNETTNAYDNLGRILRRTEPEGVTIWKYYHQGTKVMDAPVSIDGPGHTTLFEYSDTYLRLTHKTETIDGVPYTYKYTYDDNNRVTSLGFPSSLQLDYTYGAIGQLDHIAYNGISLFRTGQCDGGGRYTKYQLGSLPATTRSYEHGLPTRIETAGISHLELKWDPTSANLLSRWERDHALHEAFEYDHLNRLRSSTVSTTDEQGQVVSQVSHHNFKYDGDIGHTKGNLLVKSDIGQLNYLANKATSALHISYPVPPDQPPYVISLETQTISYTSHHKAKSVTETVNGVSHDLTYSYGTDHQRRTSTRRENGQVKEVRTYVGAYEKQVSDGVTRELHHVYGGDGFCAILVRQGGSLRINLVLKDHLGSITKVVEAAGPSWYVAAEQNFDAWGRRRKPTTWEHDDEPNGPAWLYRGYTGHEHVEPFRLINMNGRMYDPLNARMLSADPVVASSSSSQAFNRYSYAFNNPLKYTDPDGRLPILAIMAVGAIVNAGVQGFTVGFDNPWQFAGALVVGAASSAAGYGAAVGMTSLIGGSAMGFFNGALVGAAGGAAGGAVYGFGNSWNTGSSFSVSLARGWRDAKTGAWTGALAGGIGGGIAARKAGHGFWDGRLRVRETIRIPGINIHSTGEANCMADGFAATDQSFGGNLTAAEFREMVAPGSDPKLTGLRLGDSMSQYRTYSGREMAFVEEWGWQRELLPAVQNDGARVLIMSPGLGMDHVTVLESISKTTVIGANGSLIGGGPRLSYRVMDPFNGGSFSTISLRNALGALIIY